MSYITLNTTLADEALFVAKTQCDIREEKGNTGPEVRRYLKSVGLGEGHPWCMSFVYWCVNMACEKLSIPNPLVKTGGVLDQWNRTTCRKIPPQAFNSIRVGDIFIQDHGKGLGHTGFILSIKGSVVKTIEGNSNDEGSREGVKVCSLDRSITTFKGIIQLP